MIGVFWSFLGVLAGVFLAAQAPINAQLARGLGLPVAAAAFSFLSGAIVLGIATLLVTRAQGISLDWKAPAPWLFVAGGVLGGAYVTIATILIPRVGAAAVMAFLVAGLLGLLLIQDIIENVAFEPFLLGMQGIDLFFKGVYSGISGAMYPHDLALVPGVDQVVQHAEQGRLSYPPADEHDGTCFGGVQDEIPGWGSDLHHIAFVDVVVQAVTD